MFAWKGQFSWNAQDGLLVLEMFGKTWFFFLAHEEISKGNNFHGNFVSSNRFYKKIRRSYLVSTSLFGYTVYFKKFSQMENFFIINIWTNFILDKTSASHETYIALKNFKNIWLYTGEFKKYQIDSRIPLFSRTDTILFFVSFTH